MRLMHIAREADDYWPDFSVQFYNIVVSVHEVGSLDGWRPGDYGINIGDASSTTSRLRPDLDGNIG